MSKRLMAVLIFCAFALSFALVVNSSAKPTTSGMFPPPNCTQTCRLESNACVAVCDKKMKGIERMGECHVRCGLIFKQCKTRCPKGR